MFHVFLHRRYVCGFLPMGPNLQGCMETKHTRPRCVRWRRNAGGRTGLCLPRLRKIVDCRLSTLAGMRGLQTAALARTSITTQHRSHCVVERMCMWFGRASRLRRQRSPERCKSLHTWLPIQTPKNHESVQDGNPSPLCECRWGIHNVLQQPERHATFLPMNTLMRASLELVWD